MDDIKIARVTGGIGVACVALTFGQFPLRLSEASSCIRRLWTRSTSL